jgi:hypothetical protein
LTPRTRSRVVLAGLVVALAACHKDSLPAAPSAFDQGISIYEDANYIGTSALIATDVTDLKDFNGPCRHESSSTDGNGIPNTTTFYDWNDCVSSIRVAAGWRAILFRDEDFSGQRLEVTANVPNLQLVTGSCDHDGLNDCITSIKLFGP